MRTVYKYTIEKEIEDLYIPEGAKFLHSAQVGYQLSLWFEVEPEAEKVQRRFRIFGTGHDIPEGYDWVTTIPTGDGFIWHVYEAV